MEVGFKYVFMHEQLTSTWLDNNKSTRNNNFKNAICCQEVWKPMSNFTNVKLYVNCAVCVGNELMRWLFVVLPPHCGSWWRLDQSAMRIRFVDALRQNHDENGQIFDVFRRHFCDKRQKIVAFWLDLFSALFFWETPKINWAPNLSSVTHCF